MAPLRVIVPRERAREHEALVRFFGDVPECQVILDRRRRERRRGQDGYEGADRRRTERRAHGLDTPEYSVLAIS